MKEFSTPMMKQYASIKQNHEDCLLFFRLGDFYELFMDDAKIGARVLDITLTKRPRGKDGHIPMAGVPHHAADGYIAKLVRAGYKVAICEQVSEPDTKGIVDREVVRIVTPGTILDEKNLSKKEHNYTMSISLGKSAIGIAVVDVGTGDFHTTEIKRVDDLSHSLGTEIARFSPSECIVSESTYSVPDVLHILRMQQGMNVYALSEWDSYTYRADQAIRSHFDVRSLKSFGIDDNREAQEACSALLSYIRHTQKDRIGHVRTIRWYMPGDFVELDRSTLVNLELFSTIRERDEYGSLLSIIDKTTTAMGGRMLKEWLRKPLTGKEAIEQRLAAVEELVKMSVLRNSLKDELKHIYDIERIVSRLTVGVGTPVDLINLRMSLEHIRGCKKVLAKSTSPLLQKIHSDLSDALKDISLYIGKHIVPDPSLDPKKGGVIQNGVNKKLDEMRKKVGGNKDWIAELESTERQKTGIGSLKVKFNKVFGYYIEISKANIQSVPDTYIRKQTMVNAERYITPELKEYESLILSGEEVIHSLEYEIYQSVVRRVLDDTEVLQKSAERVAALDCIIGNAECAELYGYCKPTIVQERGVSIAEGRHPVVEQLSHERFIANDVTLDRDDHELLVITGPNMAGKSVFMRQTALIVLMAHVGMYVPATEATIGLVDKIFVRSGATDVIAKGLSTFMVEMVETAHILNHASERSFVVMDEIGRGTSTYDGISIAWAVAEYLATQIRAKTLFATHYHELQELETLFPEKIKNYQVAVKEQKGDPVFLHKVIQGGASHSYAVVVAKRAGVPKVVTSKATKVLNNLEKGAKVPTLRTGKSLAKQKGNHIESEMNQPELQTIRETLQDLAIANTTPLEALNILSDLKATLEESNDQLDV